WQMVLIPLLTIMAWLVADSPLRGPIMSGPADVLIETVLRESAKNDGAQESRFFRALQGLARQNGWRFGWFIYDGQAIKLKSEPNSPIIVILRGHFPSIPSQDTQYLLLLDRKAECLIGSLAQSAHG